MAFGERRRGRARLRESAAARVARCDAGAAVADDVGGDALHELEVHRRAEDGGVVVRVDVDEAGGDGEAGGVDGARGVAVDAPTAAMRPSRTAMSAGKAGRAGAVDDVAATDEEVELGHGGSHSIRGAAAESTEGAKPPGPPCIHTYHLPRRRVTPHYFVVRGRLSAQWARGADKPRCPFVSAWPGVCVP